MNRGKSLVLTVALLGSVLSGHLRSSAAGQEQAGMDKRIAIVIDDFGNAMKGTEQMLDLPVKITVAVMPFLPTTKKDAEEAFRKGHDVIVHLPMEPMHGKRSWLGPGAIMTDLTDGEIRKRVEAAIDDVPHAIGMNNHMGSKATSDERVMKVVLRVCKERGLFFLDSRTSYRTVVPKVAAELGVQTLHNNVFLDDVYTPHHVSRQIGEVKKFLQNHERCVAIGHVGPPGMITSGMLRGAIPGLMKDANFIPVSGMLTSPPTPVHGDKHK
ncbi:divergent polysaccharide deacetylase family protein [Cohnella panacarvi]|uniref:divergent polysaccharide deacetylase family protein n=1 Tax=Cohnella panacarvi TaxID=400776 RepID=UPI0006842B08|nr:divergent polysaccharide deacetylase family protein [Cohnella panacarvi]